MQTRTLIFSAIIIIAVLAIIIVGLPKFMTQPPPPAPSFISPSNGASLTNSSVSFHWGSSAGATDYQIEISGPTSKNQTVTATSYTVDLTQGSYMWRVRAHGGSGYSSWTPYWDFNVTLPSIVVTVVMRDNFYDPVNLTIAVGTTVKWVNMGKDIHTATSDTGVWNSGILQPGQSYSYTFNLPGTYTYTCAVHFPDMKGTIIVNPK